MQSRFCYSIFVSVFVLFSRVAFGQTGIITTIAGSGVAGATGDGGPATSAQLNGPDGIAIDASGNLYIADLGNNEIRKVSAGTITTLAGNYGSAQQFGGDGGPAAAAYLEHPEDVAVDSAGNIYIVDSFNNRIREVNASTGQISTIAGTGTPQYDGDGLPATSASLNDPAGVAVDSAGNIYIADQSSHRVRKINIATGLISTIAGNGIGAFSGDGGPAASAQVNFPTHVAIDTAGNIYIADSQNHRIRKISAVTGIITTIAGTGDAGSTGDGGPATAAQLSIPYRLAVDRAGNVFVADSGAKRVRYINARTGEIDTIAGGGINNDNCPALTSSLHFPIAVALDGPGTHLYIADYDDNRIRVVALTDTLSKPVITSINPASGIRNGSYVVTLTGSGFLAESSATCAQSTATLSISGTGISSSNLTVSSDSSLSATLTVAANAALGTYDITVITPEGTSGPAHFTVTQPPPILMSITPARAFRGSTVSVNLTGNAFDSGGTRVIVSGTGILVSNITITNSASINATFAISNTASLGSYNIQVVTAGGTSNAVTFSVDPQALTVVYSIPQMLNPTEQAPLSLQLANSTADPISGQLSVTFFPNAVNNADDPSVSLINSQTSTRTINFTFAPNTTEAQFSLPGVLLHAGTVSGTIRLTISGAQEAGIDVTISPGTFDVTVPGGVPVLTDVSIMNRTSLGFDVQITGYSTSREIKMASFQLAGTAGSNLQTSTLQVNVADPFNAYFQSAPSATVGGTFIYVQPFNVHGNVNAIASVTVTLSNSAGDSLPKTAN